MEINEYITRTREEVNQELNQVISLKKDGNSFEVIKAARYALLSTGKRIRPILTLALAEAYDNPLSKHKRMKLAQVGEVIQSASLIYDDLPEQDDADLRRGKPTTHIEFDKGIAQLAAQYLVLTAIDLVNDNSPQEYKEQLVRMSNKVGKRMLKGQEVDLKQRVKTEEDVLKMYERKTGDLFYLSARLGLFHVWPSDKIERFGHNLGVAYQIVDDIIDVTQTTEEAGKDTNKDEGKLTMLDILGGVDAARQKAIILKERVVRTIRGNETLEQLLNEIIKIPT